MKITNVYNYIKSRAKYEGVKFQLTRRFFQDNFDLGIRSFFMVEIDDNGKLLEDNQFPEFFKQYNS